MHLKKYIHQLIHQQNLSAIECEIAMDELLQTDNVPQIAAFLTLLHAKSETPDEIYGLIRGMQKKMLTISPPFPVLDIVGTGGDGAHTINISTGSAILAASIGVKVAKHGNRAVSSLCGSADVLEALGVNINQSPQAVLQSLITLGIGFCYAPIFHPALKQLKKIRNDLGVSTSLNILGPLLNPAQAQFALIGVSKLELLPLIADVLMLLPIQKALVFHSQPIDELNTAGPATIIEITAQSSRQYILDPQSLGFQKCELSDLRGGDAPKNAALLQHALTNLSGPITDTLILNAAIAAYIYGLTDSVQAGISLATHSITTGKAIDLLNQWIKLTGILQNV